MTWQPYNNFPVIAMIGAIMMIALPAISWALIPEKARWEVRTWYTGAMLQGGVVPLFLGQFTAHGDIFLSATRICSAFSLVFFVEVLRGELGLVKRRSTILICSFTQYSIYLLVEYGLGWKQQAFLLMLSFFILTDFYLTVLALRIARRRQSASMVAVAAGFAAASISHLLRLTSTLGSGRSAILSDPNAISGVALSLLFICAALYSFGYWGFCFENVVRREQALSVKTAHAVARREAAEENAERMQSLLAERDRMMILNSRFSALSGLSMFNGALVHEFAQPLQAARAAVEVLPLVSTMDGPELSHRTATVLQLIDRMTNLLGVFQRMLRDNSPEVAPVDCHGALERMLPVIDAEVRRRGGSVSIQGLEDCRGRTVLCNETMLERVIMNVAINAIDAVESNAAGSEQRLEFSFSVCDDGRRPVLRLAVSDTGPGIAPDDLKALFEPLATGHAGGIGLGMALAQSVVRSWSGTITAHNRQDRDGGSTIEIRLPLLRRHSA